MTNVREPIENIAKINEAKTIDDAIEKKLNEARIKNPVWKPDEIGATLTGTVSEILDFPMLNDGKGSILANIETSNDEYPKVAFWLNTVAISQMMAIIGEKPINDSFEEKVKILKEMTDKNIAIRYLGTSKASKKGYKPYQNYVIVEI